MRPGTPCRSARTAGLSGPGRMRGSRRRGQADLTAARFFWPDGGVRRRQLLASRGPRSSAQVASKVPSTGRLSCWRASTADTVVRRVVLDLHVGEREIAGWTAVVDAASVSTWPRSSDTRATAPWRSGDERGWHRDLPLPGAAVHIPDRHDAAVAEHRRTVGAQVTPRRPARADRQGEAGIARAGSQRGSGGSVTYADPPDCRSLTGEEDVAVHRGAAVRPGRDVGPP